MSAIFKTVSWQVQQLISYVENGTISLPDLQRPFVWPKSKVRDLLDSMYRGYPVGELMFWDVSGDGDTRTISGASGVEAAHQIVDGQQRLTSLFASIKGRKVRNSDYQDKDITISFNPFTQKFEVWTPAQARSPLWLEDVATYFASPTRERRNFIKRYESESARFQWLHLPATSAELRGFSRVRPHRGTCKNTQLQMGCGQIAGKKTPGFPGLDGAFARPLFARIRKRRKFCAH